MSVSELAPSVQGDDLAGRLEDHDNLAVDYVQLAACDARRCVVHALSLRLGVNGGSTLRAVDCARRRSDPPLPLSHLREGGLVVQTSLSMHKIREVLRLVHEQV